ncbi:cardiolipin synthase [Paenibacillus xylaniclasticus]|uniref:cardiolipin synthase n=1 Tax=Paenibacillus xylaniclasticus TaxID=588083 RepID=UPI000FDC577A|nr:MULTISPECIES: cardiolipin synthase [Paenibacillus]GFN33261.1 major cardiolipin synthase ClsA [Paenibacillus curdlanolyticus]
MTWTAELFLFLLLLLLPVNILLAAVLVFMERRNVEATWSWLMVLLFVPVLGFALYMFLGQNMRRRKLYRLDRRYREQLNAAITEQARMLAEGWPADEDGNIDPYRKLIDLNSKRSLLTLHNEVDFFTDGLAKFERLLADIAAAEHHIHMQYYIFNNDVWGRRIRDALIAKAKEGVHVRLLYDDIGSNQLSDSFFEEFDASGAQRAIFFPSRIRYLNYRINYRNHRKIVVIDSRIGYTGGFNVGDEYVGLDPRFGHWRDTHMRITGESVASLQSLFLMDWSLAKHRVVQHRPEFFLPAAKELAPDKKLAMQLVASGPSDQWRYIENSLLHMIYTAKKTILVQTPYFVPDESLLNALRVASLSGVDVRIMIPSIADHMFVHWATRYYVGELLQAGVKCYLYDNGFLHAKMMVIDGAVATVGTANFDIRSLQLNFEVNAIFYDRTTAKRLEDIYWNDVKLSKPFTLTDYNNRSAWSKFNESLSKLLSPIL